MLKHACYATENSYNTDIQHEATLAIILSSVFAGWPGPLLYARSNVRVSHVEAY